MNATTLGYFDSKWKRLQILLKRRSQAVWLLRQTTAVFRTREHC